MSVEISIYLVDWNKLQEELSHPEALFEEDGFFENCEDVTPDYGSAKAQMFFLEQLEEIIGQLTPETRTKVEELIDVLFYSWRDDDGKRIQELDAELDELDTALSPATAKRFAALYESIPMEELHALFATVEDKEEYYDENAEYLATYGRGLQKAAAEDKGFVILMFG